MSTKKLSIFAEAANNWPEDEAGLLAQSVEARIENEWTTEEMAVQLAKDIAHMHKVFGFEPDAADLIARFDARLAKLMEGTK
jgi:ABC-type enterochelin transport system substrate-binding protein